MSPELPEEAFPLQVAADLGGFLEEVERDPLWRRARDPEAVLTLAERQAVHRRWAEVIGTLDALDETARRASGDPAARLGRWAALARGGARMYQAVAGSRRLRIMLDERVPGTVDRPLSLNRVARLALGAARRLDRRRARRVLRSEAMRGLRGAVESALEEVADLRAEINRVRLLVLAPLALLLSDLYHHLARVLVGGGWFLYSKWIDFFRRFPITPDQIRQMRGRLQPGDILVRRREVITTRFIPGYWTHMILHLGTFDEAERFFDTPEVNDRLRALGYAGLRDCLQKLHPEALARWTAPNFIDGTQNLVLEATANGVVLNSERQALTGNSLAALRPRLSRECLVLCLLDALALVGRDFDYRFRFERFESLVCTQVISTAFAAGPGLAGEKNGVRFCVSEIRSLGLRRRGISPNAFVRQHVDELASGTAQLDLVYFLDGRGRDEPVVGSEETFRSSCDG